MIKKFRGRVVRNEKEINKYGSSVSKYKELGYIRGFLGYMSIEKGQLAQKMVEDTTHIFICDTGLDIVQDDIIIVKGVEYQVNYVDRPDMGTRAEIELEKSPQQKDMLELFTYFGKSSRDRLIESDVLSFDRTKTTDKLFTGSCEGKGDKLFIVQPKQFGKASIRLNHKPVIDYNIDEIMIEGIKHYIYKIKNTNYIVHIELF